MTITITSLILLVVGVALGALLWWLARPAKLSEAGRLLFFACLLALALVIGLGGHTLRL